MIITLLMVMLAIAIVVSLAVVCTFSAPVKGILKALIPGEIHAAWLRYVQFAAGVVGVTKGVNISLLERFVNPPLYGGNPAGILKLTGERWALEAYRSVIGTLQGIACVLLAFFMAAFIAQVLVRIFESRKADSVPKSGADPQATGGTP